MENLHTIEDSYDDVATEEQDEEPGYCPACAGSGEGQYDGTRCRVCRGRGES